MSGAWYNEPHRGKAAALRQLIEAKLIAPGVVDERPIQAVRAEDLHGFTQHHFFAGIGVWSYALRLAGWPDDRPVWTGSCPCGPFSLAGLQKGFSDPRHLWPEWFPLIRISRPDCIFGEQSDAASAWIDLISDNLESIAYAIGAPDIPSAGFSGAHKRQRFYWVADTNNAQRWSERAPWHDGDWTTPGWLQGDGDAGDGGLNGGLGLAHGPISTTHAGNTSEVLGLQAGQRTDQRSALLGGTGEYVKLGYPSSQGPQGCDTRTLGQEREAFERAGGMGWLVNADSIPGVERGSLIRGRFTGSHAQPRTGLGRASDVDWLWCRDSTWRPVEPGTSPLVDEAPARVGRLLGYGDAIDAETAANFIASYMECSN